MRLEKLSMQFSTEETNRADEVLEAYERLILDAMAGDHTLFTTADGIESLWTVPFHCCRIPVGQTVRTGVVGSQSDSPAHRAPRVAFAVRTRLAGQK